MAAVGAEVAQPEGEDEADAELSQGAQPARGLWVPAFFLTAALMPGSASLMLFSAAMECDGLSGRALRKLPFLAHALFCSQASMPYEQYVVCLARAAEQEKRSREDVAAKAAT